MSDDWASMFAARKAAVAQSETPAPRSSTGPRPAIEVSRVSKIYRRYSQRKQFATLKSALLSRSLIKNLRPDETFTALNDVSLTVPKGRTLGVIGRNGSGQRPR